MTQFDVKSAGSIADLEGYRLRVVNRLWDFLDSVADGELATDRDVNTHGGEVLRYTPGDILGHIVIHERAYHGDVSTLFYQLGLADQMPMIDYRFYVDSKRQQS